MRSDVDRGYFSVSEAAHIAKVPVSTLRYWLRTELFAPLQKMRPRLLTFADLRDVVVADTLRKQGAPTRHVRQALNWVRSNHDIRRLAEASFAVGDNGLQFLTAEGELIAPHQGNQGIFKICMADVFRQLGYTEDLVTMRPHERISIDPRVRGGTPVIEGTRIPAQLVAQLASEGSVEEVLGLYPSLAKEDVVAAIDWVAEVA